MNLSTTQRFNALSNMLDDCRGLILDLKIEMAQEADGRLTTAELIAKLEAQQEMELSHGRTIS
jgi:hypothetical protein